MNGLTHNELVKLKRRLEREDADVAKLILQELEAGGGGAYRESAIVDAETGSTTDRSASALRAFAAARDAIGKSIAAMDAGSYGACAECGRHIGLKRLFSVPTATLCVHCDSKQARIGSRNESAPVSPNASRAGRKTGGRTSGHTSDMAEVARMIGR